MSFKQKFTQAAGGGSQEQVSHERRSRPGTVKRQTKDQLAKKGMIMLTSAVICLVPLIAIALLLRSLPILSAYDLGTLIFSTEWKPLQGLFGFSPFLAGTVWVTAISMIIAVPPSLLTAVFLSEYAPNWLRSAAVPLIDLLAGIPSVVFGIWGVLTIVPFIDHRLAPAVDRWLGFSPLFRAENPTGYGVLAGGIVLAVMVFPLIISVAEEVIRNVPWGLREASLSLGATRWETVRYVLLRKAFPGIIAAVMLGFSRAFGETMAVLMVVGNVPKIPGSIFDPAYPLTALIANNYGEMMSIPLYDAALMAAALILLVVVFLFNFGSRLILIPLIKNI